MLNSHLDYTSQEYDQKADQRKVHPISRVDAEIIMELMNICTELQIPSLIEVLEQWKRISDDRVLSELKEILVSLEENGEIPSKDKSESPVIEYIEIQDETIRVKDIFRIKKIEGYVENNWMYGIHLNPIDENVTSIAGTLLLNAIFYYPTIQSRDSEIDDLKSKLTKNKKCKFI